VRCWLYYSSDETPGWKPPLAALVGGEAPN
jgi:hypothetical protein